MSAVPAFAVQIPKPSPAIAKKSAPQAPASLASQPPVAATVTWHHGRLAIHAKNSTLIQILQAITAQSGMKVQGSPGNQRIFGTYGPGRPRAVLTQLLSGSHFNYLLVGTASNGAPRKLIITGTASSAPEPPQPVQSVQPAPQNPTPQTQFGPRPSYHPSPSPQPRRQTMPVNHQNPHTVPTPQEILKKLEAMRKRQAAARSH